MRFRPQLRQMSTAVLIPVLIFHMAKNLFKAGFYRPDRALCALKLWLLFLGAHKRAGKWIDGSFTASGLTQTDRKRLVRYARNTLGLVAVQPEYQRSGWKWPERETEVGITYGLCIPLYDDSFDEVGVDEAVLFGHRFHKSLIEEIWDPEKVPDGAWISKDALRMVSRALWTCVDTDDRAGFSELLREMNSAQLESLNERVPGTCGELLMEVSARKGIASFQLLLSALGIPENGLMDEPRKAAAVWAQWMDDYDDLDSDRIQGSETMISRLNDQSGSEDFIRSGLERVTELLEGKYHREGKTFSTMLKLSFIVKISHKETNRIAEKLGPHTKMPAFFWKGNPP